MSEERSVFGWVGEGVIIIVSKVQWRKRTLVFSFSFLRGRYILITMRYFFFLLLFWLWSTSFAWVLTLQPQTADLHYQCRSDYPFVVDINTEWTPTTAVDAKVFFEPDTIVFGDVREGFFTGYPTFNPTSPFGYVTGDVLWQTYLYINAVTSLWGSQSAGIVTSWSNMASFYLKPINKKTSTDLSFYFVPWQNTVDSNIQSGVVNWFTDILTTVNNGTYMIKPLPCFSDIQPPFATWYSDGEVLWQTGIRDVTVTDWFGEMLSGGDSTFHYRREGWVWSFPWTDYVSVWNREIDNQSWVDPTSIQITFSWTELRGFLWWWVHTSPELLPPVTFSLFDFLGQNYLWPWDERTRQDLVRWYSLWLLVNDLWADTNQRIDVNISMNDRWWLTWETQTYFYLTGIDDVPPYIESSQYETWTYPTIDHTPSRVVIAGHRAPLLDQNRKVYSKTWIILSLTWNESVKFFSWNALSALATGQYLQTTLQNTLFSGVFRDVAWNTWWTHLTWNQEYLEPFVVHTFWYDDVAPDISVVTTWNNTIFNVSVDPSQTWFDDDVVVYGLSGLMNDWFVQTEMWWESIMNWSWWLTTMIYGTWYGWSQTVTMSGSSRSWDLLVRDRAGNITWVFIDFYGEFDTPYIIIARPKYRVRPLLDDAYTNSWMLARVTFFSGLVYDDQTTRMLWWQEMWSDVLKFDQYWETIARHDLPAGEYEVMVEWMSHQAQIMTWVMLDWPRTIDFTEQWLAQPWDLMTFVDCGWGATSMLTSCSRKDGSINYTDVAVMISWVQPWVHQVYDNVFHVYKNNDLWQGIRFVDPIIDYRLNMYHPADLDADGDLTAWDFAIIINTILSWQPSQLKSMGLRGADEGKRFEDIGR